MFVAPLRWRLIFLQLQEVGYRSQLVVIVTGDSPGGVCGADLFSISPAGYGHGRGPVVAVSMFRELGPVLTGLMVSGRVGAAMSRRSGR